MKNDLVLLKHLEATIQPVDAPIPVVAVSSIDTTKSSMHLISGSSRQNSTTLIRVGDVNLQTFQFSGFYDYDLDLRIGTPILNFTEIFFA